MAEIPIERKESRNWLPLVLGLLALLLLLAFCFLRPKNNETAARPADTAAVAAQPAADSAAPAPAAPAAGGNGNAAIDRFVQFVQTRDTTNETEGQHQYTAEGTRRLAAALEGIAGQSPDIKVYADSMRRSIERLQQSSPSDVHADDAKAAFSAAVSAMAAIDKARGRTNDVAPLRATYQDLSGRRPLMPQLPTVDRFFKAAAENLQKMRA